MTDPTSPATIARAEERRPQHTEDESLTDHIIDDLTVGDLIYYEPLSGQHWTNDLPAVIERVAELVRWRVAEEIRAASNARRKTHAAAYVAGMHVAGRVAEDPDWVRRTSLHGDVA